MTITIPDELVPLLREGLYYDLEGQLEEAGSLIEPRRDREANLCSSVDGCFARANGTRALLDVLGWIEPLDILVVEVDVREHRAALVRASLIRIESEQGVEEHPEVSDENRAAAKARIGQFADLIAQVEASDV